MEWQRLAGATAMDSVTLVHPVSRQKLVPDTPHSLTDGEHRVPVVSGIPYLRTGRDELVQDVLGALDANEPAPALAMLLRDQDDFAPLPPPDISMVVALISDPHASFRDAMAALNFGPVAHYFAHRWSAPTFLSAMALVAHYAPRDALFVDVACGTGQVVREVERLGGIAVGVDQVFAKLWLGQRYLDLSGLICANAQDLPLVNAQPAAVLCHDALYFMPDETKAVVLTEMRRVARAGPVLAGHCHVAGHRHAGTRAHPLSVAGWHALMPGAYVFDDEALTDFYASAGAKPLVPHNGSAVGAVALAEGTPLARPRTVWSPPQDLTENPLLHPDGAGGLAPVWPAPAFEHEYAGAHYLHVADAGADRARSRAERHAARTIVPLPPAW